MTKLIDLSVAIDSGVICDPPGMAPKIEYVGHVVGAADFAAAEGSQSSGDRRISVEQDDPVMRILTLSKETEARLFRARENEDREALKTAAKIVADVRKRGDRAVSDWARKLDGVDFQRQGLWISRGEFAAARKRVSREFLRAVEHAARNVGRS